MVMGNSTVLILLNVIEVSVYTFTRGLGVSKRIGCNKLQNFEFPTLL